MSYNNVKCDNKPEIENPAEVYFSGYLSDMKSNLETWARNSGYIISPNGRTKKLTHLFRGPLYGNCRSEFGKAKEALAKKNSVKIINDLLNCETEADWKFYILNSEDF